MCALCLCLPILLGAAQLQRAAAAAADDEAARVEALREDDPPPMPEKSITLRYFDSRGRGESVRLLLSAVGADWAEVRYDRCAPDCPEGVEDWAAAKAAGLESGLLPFGQVPSLTFCDFGPCHHLVQTEAILRALGSRYEVEPTGSEVKMAVDVFVGGLWDLRGKYSRSLAYNQACLDDPSILASFAADILPTWLGYLEKLLPSPNSWVGGSQHWTWADVFAFDVLDTVALRVNPHALSELPKLRALANRVASLPDLKQYLLSDRRRAYANGKSACFDTLAHPIMQAPDWTDAEPGKYMETLNTEM